MRFVELTYSVRCVTLRDNTPYDILTNQIGLLYAVGTNVNSIVFPSGSWVNNAALPELLILTTQFAERNCSLAVSKSLTPRAMWGSKI
jgi:hypothetical protein